MSLLPTKILPDQCDYAAPDGSEIRLLAGMAGGGVCHCTLPPGGVSLAVRHRTVDEIWYVLHGAGQMWRKLGEVELEEVVGPGSNLTIPLGAHFQFRNTGDVPLCILITTMPPWPGPDEAVRVEDHWPIGPEMSQT